MRATRANATAWRPIESAPLEHNIEVQVKDGFGEYALPFPCRLTPLGWRHGETHKLLKLAAIKWREPSTHARSYKRAG